MGKDRIKQGKRTDGRFKEMGKKISLLTLCALNGIKEALYLLVAPFLPE
jgi:hypothetical protein